MTYSSAETRDIKSVLVIEDEGLIAMDLKRRLEDDGYSVPAIGATAEEAIRLAEFHAPDLILMDIRLKGEKDGIAASGEVRRRFDIPVIFVTSHADPETLERAKECGPFGYIVKPFVSVDFRAQIEMARYRHQAERKLRGSEAWLSATLRNVGEGVIATDVNGSVNFMNPAAEFLTGWTLKEAIGRPSVEVLSVVAPGTIVTLNPVFAALDPEGEGMVRAEYQLFSRAGTICHVECITTLNRDEEETLGAVIVFKDITAQRDFAKYARQSSKMDALAVMAGALAHDFNNLLTIVLGYVDVLQDTPERKCPELEEIRRAGELAAGLARQLLTVSRRDTKSTETLELNEAVGANAKMMQQVIGHENSLIFERCERDLTVRADRGQISQILVNLAANARDAMRRNGTLRVSVGERAGHAELTVADTGIGMTAETVERIFEPFFTQKGKQGTGLGMTIVHSLITQWGGTIKVLSEIGKGTTFEILLPLVAPELGAAPRSLPELKALEHTGRVLLVEDNDELRRLLRNHFERAGLEVIAAESGEEALMLMNMQPGAVDLLITDVMMPKMTGPELAKRCVERTKDLPVLFISGYSSDALRDNDMVDSGRADFMQKPLALKELVDKARTLMAKENE